MNKNNKKHLGIYLGSIIACEIVLFLIILILFIKTQSGFVWELFGWLQFIVPLTALWPFLIIEGVSYYDAMQKAQEERDKKVDEIVKYVEKTRKDDNK